MEARTPVHRTIRGTKALVSEQSLFPSLVMLVALAAGPAQAPGIVVNTLADGSLAGACTLRDAIAAANMDAAVSGCTAGSGADTITFSVSGTITLTSALELVSGSTVTIDGTGHTVTISGNNETRVMVMQGGATLHFQNVTVANGNSNRLHDSVSGTTFAHNRADNSEGGAIFAIGTVSISNSTFSENTSGIGGGGIFNPGSLIVANSTFSANGGHC